MGIGRSKIIGRSHSVNGQVFLCGLPEDYDSWAVAGNNQWSFVNVLPLLRKQKTDLVRAALREQMMNPRLPCYHRMLVAAGYPVATDGVWSDAMIDGAVIWGDESRAPESIAELFAFGATEVPASPVTAGPDQATSLGRTMRLLG